VDEWVKIISQVGFPIAVAGYLLIRLENTIKDNTEQTIKQAETMQRMASVIDKMIWVLSDKGIKIEVTEKDEKYRG